MNIIFAFSYKQETGEASVTGNVTIQQALIILQQLAIADAVNKAKEKIDGKGDDAVHTTT